MKITTDNYVFTMEQDTDVQSPREWDNLCQMIFFGRKEHIGDKHEIILPRDYNGREDFETKGLEDVKKAIGDVVLIKPVYAYIHSGMSISLSSGYPYNCQWDSGIIGFAVITKSAIREGWGRKRLTKKFLEENMKTFEENMEGEVETLDQWLKGEVYGFDISDNDENHVEGCWGFYGDNPLENGMFDHIFTEEIREAIQKEFA